MNSYITYGYRLADGYARTNPEQSETVHLTFNAYDGGEFIKKIIGILKDRKTPTTRGKPSWTPALTRKILRSRDYLGVEPYSRVIEKEQSDWVQECLECSRDLWNQRHSTGSIRGTSMHIDRLICSSYGGVYIIYRQSSRCDNRNVRYWKCRRYDLITKEPCKISVMTEKQLDGVFLQAPMQMKTESALYHKETKKMLRGFVKERQRMEPELSVCWNRYSEDDEGIEQLHFQIAARRYQEIEMTGLTCQIKGYLRGLDGSVQIERIDSSIFRITKRIEVQPDRSLRFQLTNNAAAFQYPEIRTTKNKKSENIHHYVLLEHWLDGQGTPIIHEQHGPIIQMLF